jgi:hypothetical protein
MDQFRRRCGTTMKAPNGESAMSFRTPLRTASHLTCVVALALAFSNPATAQITKPKNAVKNLKYQSQQIIREAKKKLVAPKNLLGLEISIFTKTVASNPSSTDSELLTELFLNIDKVQAEVSDAVQTAVRTMRDNASVLLGDIDAPSVDPALGIFPENFYRGDQGHLDTFHSNVREISRKSLKLARHRMKRLDRNVRKNTTIELTWRVGPDLALPALVASAGSVAPIDNMLMVDLVMAHSDTLLADDGAVHASGSATGGHGDVTVEVYDTDGSLVASEISTLSDGTNPLFQFENRWVVHFAGLQEGNYQILAKQGSSQSLTAIGIR